MSKGKTSLGPALINAARQGDLGKVRELVAQGADVNYAPPAGTPLQNAISSGKPEVAAELIKAGADVNQQTIFGTLVMGAVRSGNPQMLKLLIEAGAELKGGPLGGSPLLQAVTENKLAMAEILLAAGADVNEKGSVVCGGFGEPEVTEKGGVRTTHVPNPPVARDATALIVAARRGFEEMARLLLNAGADANLTDHDGFSALVWAKREGHQRVAALLEQAGAKAPEFAEGSGTAALLAAARAGDCRRLRELIAKKLDLAAKQGTEEEAERTPLVCAAEHGHVEAARLLLDAGADVNQPCGSGWQETHHKTALMYAAENGHVPVIELLLERKAKLNAKDREPGGGGGRIALHYAAEKGHTEAIRALVQAGSKPYVKTSDGEVPLTMAASEGHLPAVKLLLELGADPNYISKDDFTALYAAASEGHAEVVKALLAAGADPNPDVDDFLKPLEGASSEGHKKVVKLLLDAGAAVQSGDGEAGESPLVNAAMMGGADVVKTLLDAGADPNKPGDEGFTPLMGAVRAGNFEVVKMLLDAGVNVNALSEHYETALDMAYDNIEAAKGQAEFLKLITKGKMDDDTKKAVEMIQNAGDSDEVVELLRAHGAKRAQELEPTVRRDEEDEEDDDDESGATPELPDFSGAAQSEDYARAIGELERLCGAKPKPLVEDDDEASHLAGCLGFQIASDKAVAILREHHAVFLKRGFHLVRCDRGYVSGKDRIALLPTASWRDVLLAMQTNGANYDLMSVDIIRWLDELEKEQPFELTGVNFDWCEGRFTEPIKNSRQLAKKMYEFCPDIVDQGVGTVAGLAKELQKSQVFFFWWD
ncbi:MAG: ankyrin repeat domain-containing protein [Verrucomicrobiota bacterium]